MIKAVSNPIHGNINGCHLNIAKTFHLAEIPMQRTPLTQSPHKQVVQSHFRPHKGGNICWNSRLLRLLPDERSQPVPCIMICWIKVICSRRGGDCADDDEDIVSGGVYCGSSRENGKIETGWIIIINFPPIRVYCGLNFESPSRWWSALCWWGCVWMTDASNGAYTHNTDRTSSELPGEDYCRSFTRLNGFAQCAVI